MELMSFDILQAESDGNLLRKNVPELTSEIINHEVASLDECIVWVVPQKVREELAKFPGVIEDKGVKHPAVELARTMLSGKGNLTPMIDGQYTSVGKLTNGVQRLLQRAVDSPRRLFIIAVADQVFDKLLQTAKEKPLSTSAATPFFSGLSGEVLNQVEKITESPLVRKAFIGESNDAMAIRQFIMRAAKADDTVMIIGDTGTGKEIVAQQIHKNSNRKDKPFRAVNCAAFPPDLLESELFGHARGAFTGAITSNEGLWKSADGGTLFLDEVSELSPGHQAKILRALQENMIKRVGAAQEVQVNARVICATNRDLLNMVQKGQFRTDLYYRLRCFLITTTPLREHPGDIPILAQFFWKRITKSESAILPNDVLGVLQEYAWPGNVRELKTLLSALYSYYSDVSLLESRHVRAVFNVQHMHFCPETEKGTPPDASEDNISIFHLLRRTYETIRAIEYVVLPLLGDDKSLAQEPLKISTGIGNLVKEIEIHRRIPGRFTPRIFDNMGLLQSRLTYFLFEYEKFPEKAVEILRAGDTRRVVEDLISDILAEIGRILTDSL